MATQLDLRQPRGSRVVDCVLGRSSLTAIGSAVVNLLDDTERSVTVNVCGFDYFDEHELTALMDITTWSPRVQIVGLEGFADQLLPSSPQDALQAQTFGARAVTHLLAITVITALVGGHVLDDYEWEHAMQLAVGGGRAIVTADLRHVARLTPAQVLTLAETSAELHRDGRTMIIVNASAGVADQLRSAGLSGGLRMNVDDLR